MWNQFIVGTDYKSFNRTFMELKSVQDSTHSVFELSFNRTFMELKWISLID